MDSLIHRVSLPHRLQDVEYLAASLARPNVPPQLVVVQVVERQPMTHAVRAAIRCRQAVGLAGRPPTASGLRTNLQRAELVEADRRAIGRSLVHVPPDQLFFRPQLRVVALFPRLRALQADLVGLEDLPDRLQGNRLDDLLGHQEVPQLRQRPTPERLAQQVRRAQLPSRR